MAKNKKQSKNTILYVNIFILFLFNILFFSYFLYKASLFPIDQIRENKFVKNITYLFSKSSIKINPLFEVSIQSTTSQTFPESEIDDTFVEEKILNIPQKEDFNVSNGNAEDKQDIYIKSNELDFDIKNIQKIENTQHNLSEHSALNEEIVPKEKISDLPIEITDDIQVVSEEKCEVLEDLSMKVEKEEISNRDSNIEKINACCNNCDHLRFDCDLRSFNQYFYFDLRHTFGKGIGIDKGYSTLSGTFQAPLTPNGVEFFMDLRCHLLDTGKCATNAGLGLRYESKYSGNIFGVNVYYDSRKIRCNQLLHQIAVGLEYLSVIDCRIMGYLPLKKDRCFIEVDQVEYEGGYYIDRYKYKTPITSVFLEIGKYLELCENFKLYGAFSEYFIDLNECQRSLGARARVKFELWKFVGLEFVGSYDSIFKQKGQVFLGFTYTWGEKTKRRNKYNKFKTSGHNDIIPVGKEYRYDWNW